MRGRSSDGVGSYTSAVSVEGVGWGAVCCMGEVGSEVVPDVGAEEEGEGLSERPRRRGVVCCMGEVGSAVVPDVGAEEEGEGLAGDDAQEGDHGHAGRGR